MSVEENKAIMRRFEEAPKENAPSILDELMTENFVVHTQGVDFDLESWKRISTYMYTAFPDFRSTIEDMVAEGDKVACRLIWQGTHQGEYLNAAPTGKKVTGTMYGIYRFKEGKIAEMWMSQDRLAIFQQLGVSPPME